MSSWFSPTKPAGLGLPTAFRAVTEHSESMCYYYSVLFNKGVHLHQSDITPPKVHHRSNEELQQLHPSVPKSWYLNFRPPNGVAPFVHCALLDRLWNHAKISRLYVSMFPLRYLLGAGSQCTYCHSQPAYCCCRAVAFRCV